MRSKSGPGGTLYHYGLCELAQRQAVLVRKDKPSDRAIKSDRAKVVMTAGCISEPADITTLIYNISGDRQLDKSEFLCHNDFFAGFCYNEVSDVPHRYRWREAVLMTGGANIFTLVETPLKENEKIIFFE